MKKHQHMTKAELIKRIKLLEKGAPEVSLAVERERLLHEVQVHQVELETQNRELHEAQLLLEASRDRYANLYDFAPVGFVTFDDKGVIREINLTAAGRLGVERRRLVGRPFDRHVATGDRARFHEHLGKLKHPAGRVVTELLLARKGDSPFPVAMQSVRFYDAEKQGYLCRTALTDLTERKQAAMAVHDNEARLRAVLDTALDGIITLDECGTIESFNQAAVKLFGYSMDEAIGQNVTLLMPWPREIGGADATGQSAEVISRGEPHREAQARLLANYCDTGVRKVIGLRSEVSGRRKDGSTLPLEVSVSELQLGLPREIGGAGGAGQGAGVGAAVATAQAAGVISQGKRRIFTGIVRDITRRKQVEEALRDSEDRFRTLFESSPIAVALHGPDGRIIETNHNYQQLLGYTGKELRKLGVKQITHPEDMAVGKQFYHELVAGTRDQYQREKRYCRKDGKVFWGVSTVSAIRSPDGRLRYIISAVEDITERRRAETVTRELASIVEHSADAIISQTGDGIIASWNRSAEQIYGYAAAEVMGQPLSLLLPRDHASDLELAMGRLRDGSRVEEFETVCRRKDGDLIEVSMTVSPVRNQQGRLTVASTIARDITERKRLERKIVRIGAEERRRLSHELHDGLGQTLTGISFKAKALQGTLAQSGSLLAKDLGELARLINGAIAESRRLAQGLEPIQIESAGLVAALAGLAAETQHLFALECGFRCAEAQLSVPTATGAALYRITQEAIHNAVSHGSARTIEIELARAANQLRLCVTDDGKGFVPFETGDSGMGLRIMQHRARAIGGTLSILSQPGQGTRIECFLPFELGSVNLEKHR